MAARPCPPEPIKGRPRLRGIYHSPEIRDFRKRDPSAVLWALYGRRGHLYRAGTLPFADKERPTVCGFSVEPSGRTTQAFRGSWETAEFEMLLRKAVLSVGRDHQALGNADASEGAMAREA